MEFDMENAQFYDFGIPENHRSPSPDRQFMIQSGENLQVEGVGIIVPATANQSSSESSDNDNNDSGSGTDDASSSEAEVEESPPDRSSRINGIPVEFPFPVSERHVSVLACVTSTLKEGKNLLLEWPSDKERRITVLNGVLSYWQWKRNQQNDITPKIFYVTNSFEDISAVVKQLNRIATYKQLENLKINILGQRRDLCVNHTLPSNPSSIDTSCLRLVQNRNRLERRGQAALETCQYCPSNQQNNPDFSLVRNIPLAQFYEVDDIENLLSKGRETMTCPYYQRRRMQENEEIDFVICPKEFVLLSVLREDYDINLNNAILVFDDGYNMERICCEEEGSFIITMTKLNAVVQCLRGIEEDLGLQRGEEIENIVQLRRNILTLNFALESLGEWVREQIEAEPVPPNEAVQREEVEIRDFLVRNFPNDSIHVMKSTVKRVVELGNSSTFPVPDIELLNDVRRFLTVLGHVYNSRTHDFGMYAHVTDAPRRENRRRPTESVLKLICANPAVVFRAVASAAHSVILGAGCLAPLDSITNELGVEFHDTYRVASHDMPTNNFVFAYCNKGPNNTTFALNFYDRGASKVLREVAQSILQMCEVMPHGVVVLFHSKEVLYKVWEFVNDPRNGVDGQSVMSKLESRKCVISEHNMTSEADQERLLNEYRRFNTNQENRGSRTGGLLFALHRGKLNGKVNFRDFNIRLVIHASIPYGPWYNIDDYITAKREYFESTNGEDCGENLDWYTQEAFRVMNPWFGISVDNPSKWGAVVVLDNRMVAKRHDFKKLLPAWVRSTFTRCNNFNSLLRSLEGLVGRMTQNGN